MFSKDFIPFFMLLLTQFPSINIGKYDNNKLVRHWNRCTYFYASKRWNRFLKKKNTVIHVQYCKQQGS